MSTDVMPDIYQKAALKDRWGLLATDLKVGERVKLIVKQNQGIHEVLESGTIYPHRFQFRLGQVFVYGCEVKDFRRVDYEAIAILNISATREIYRKLEKLES